MLIFNLSLCLIGILTSFLIVKFFHKLNGQFAVKESFKELVVSDSQSESALNVLTFIFQVIVAVVPLAFVLGFFVTQVGDNHGLSLALSNGGILGAYKIMLFDFTSARSFAVAFMVALPFSVYWTLLYMSSEVYSKGEPSEDQSTKGKLSVLASSWVINSIFLVLLAFVVALSPRGIQSLNHYDFSLEYEDIGGLVNEYCQTDDHMLLKVFNNSGEVGIRGYCGGDLMFGGSYANLMHPDFSITLMDSALASAIENVEGEMDFNYAVTSESRVIHMIDGVYIPPRSTIEQLKLVSSSLSESLSLYNSEIQSSLANVEEWHSVKI